MFSYERAEVAVGCLTAHLETSWWCFLAQLSALTVQPSSNPENLQRTIGRMSKSGKGPPHFYRHQGLHPTANEKKRPVSTAMEEPTKTHIGCLSLHHSYRKPLHLEATGKCLPKPPRWQTHAKLGKLRGAKCIQDSPPQPWLQGAAHPPQADPDRRRPAAGREGWPGAPHGQPTRRTVTQAKPSGNWLPTPHPGGSPRESRAGGAGKVSRTRGRPRPPRRSDAPSPPSQGRRPRPRPPGPPGPPRRGNAPKETDASAPPGAATTPAARGPGSGRT